MKIKMVLAGLVFLGCIFADAMAADGNQSRGNMSEAQSFVTEVGNAIARARAGEFGEIADADLADMDQAHATIKALLAGHDRTRELKPAQRIELYNAQELITAIVRGDEDARRVCTSTGVTGTRQTRTECLTKAEREEKRKRAREATLRRQQGQ